VYSRPLPIITHHQQLQQYHVITQNTELAHHVLTCVSLARDVLTHTRPSQQTNNISTAEYSVQQATIDHTATSSSSWLSSMQKTSQFETQCKGDISHVFETAKITVFYPTVGKTLERPYKTSCCAEHLILLVRLHLFYANFIPLYDS